jgi:amino-acid N-acetyltransferase
MTTRKHSRAKVTLRSGDPADAATIHALITANLEEGHLLPRSLGELTVHATRFVLAVSKRKIVGCAELAPLSPGVAEVRSLVVDPGARGSHAGTMLVDELRRRAQRDGYEKLCAFTHAPGYFTRMGFSIVPHSWLLEKVFTDCLKCPQFKKCGQYAMVVPLDYGRPKSIDDRAGDDVPCTLSAPPA